MEETGIDMGRSYEVNGKEFIEEIGRNIRWNWDGTNGKILDMLSTCT